MVPSAKQTSPTGYRASSSSVPFWRKTPQAAAFGFSLTAAGLAIGVLWIITPLSYLYVLRNLLTLIPALSAGHPASYGGFHILNYILLAYCALEIPFSIYYRYLAIRAQKIHKSPLYTRKFLRKLFSTSLENGLLPEVQESEIVDVLAGIGLGTPRVEKGGYELRNRKTSTTRKADTDSESTTAAESTASSMTLAGKEDTASKGVTSLLGQTTLTPDDPRALDFQSHVRLWFHDVLFSDIHRLDMADWLSWSLYGVSHAELVSERETWEANGRPVGSVDGELDEDEDGLEIEGDKLGLVEHCVELMEARAGKRFPEGRNDKVKVIRLTLDEVRVISRPLILYCFVWLAQKLVIGNSKRHGFTEHQHGRTRYLLRMPVGWTPVKDCREANKPLVFIHGLGMGMAQYATLLSHFSTSPTLKDRPILILIQPHISMSFFSSDYLHPPSQKACTREFAAIVKEHGFGETGVTVLSHSNGTMVHGWLIKAMPELITRSCLVDPVCFCLWEPFVAFGFLYSKPKTAIEFLMRYFVSRELGIALMLQRHFDWSSNLLLPTSIPNFRSPYHTAVFMSGQDSILNAFRIRRYLRQAGMKEVKKGENVGEVRGGMKTHQKNKHGQSMIGAGRAFMQIMAWVDGELQDTQLEDSEDSN